jgi:hypothetical protein
MPRAAIWCDSCKLYQENKDDKDPKTKQCVHCGAWMPVAATFCVKCQKGVGKVSRLVSRIQLPVAGISALTALIATLSLWMFNIVDYFNRDSTTEVSLTSTNVVTNASAGTSTRSIELSVIKTGTKKSHITDVFLLARVAEPRDAEKPLAEPKDAQLPRCLDEREQPVVNTRDCNVSTGVNSICAKFPLKILDRIGITIKDDANDLVGTVDVTGAVTNISLLSNCASRGVARNDEELVKNALRNESGASSCDIYYSVRESADKEFTRRRVQAATIKDCGSFLLPGND